MLPYWHLPTLSLPYTRKDFYKAIKELGNTINSKNFKSKAKKYFSRLESEATQEIRVLTTCLGSISYQKLFSSNFFNSFSFNTSNHLQDTIFDERQKCDCFVRPLHIKCCPHYRNPVMIMYLVSLNQKVTHLNAIINGMCFDSEFQKNISLIDPAVIPKQYADNITETSVVSDDAHSSQFLLNDMEKNKSTSKFSNKLAKRHKKGASIFNYSEDFKEAFINKALEIKARLFEQTIELVLNSELCRTSCRARRYGSLSLKPQPERQRKYLLPNEEDYFVAKVNASSAAAPIDNKRNTIIPMNNLGDISIDNNDNDVKSDIKKFEESKQKHQYLTKANSRKKKNNKTSPSDEKNILAESSNINMDSLSLNGSTQKSKESLTTQQGIEDSCLPTTSILSISTESSSSCFNSECSCSESCSCESFFSETAMLNDELNFEKIKLISPSQAEPQYSGIGTLDIIKEYEIIDNNNNSINTIDKSYYSRPSRNIPELSLTEHKQSSSSSSLSTTPSLCFVQDRHHHYHHCSHRKQNAKIKAMKKAKKTKDVLGKTLTESLFSDKNTHRIYNESENTKEREKILEAELTNFANSKKHTANIDDPKSGPHPKDPCHIICNICSIFGCDVKSITNKKNVVDPSLCKNVVFTRDDAEMTDIRRMSNSKSQKMVRILSVYSLVINIMLTILKVVIYILSKSSSIFASTLDSVLDIASSLILFIVAHIDTSKKHKSFITNIVPKILKNYNKVEKIQEALMRIEKEKFPVGKIRNESIGVLVFICVLCAFTLNVSVTSVQDLFSVASDTENYVPPVFDNWSLVILIITIALKFFAAMLSQCLLKKTVGHSHILKAYRTEGLNDVLTNTIAIIGASMSSRFKKLWWFDYLGALIITKYVFIVYLLKVIKDIKFLAGKRCNWEVNSLVTLSVMHFSPFISKITSVKSYYTTRNSIIVEVGISVCKSVTETYEYNSANKIVSDISLYRGEYICRQLKNYIEQTFAYEDMRCEKAHVFLEPKVEKNKAFEQYLKLKEL